MAEFDVTAKLAATEKEAFSELKRRISNQFPEFGKEDYSIYRFLKARKFDIQKAQNMIINHMKFRERYKLDTILSDYKRPEVLEKYCTYNFLGFDKEGCPIAYMDLGNLDPKGLINSTRKEDRLKNFLYFMEELIRQMKISSEKLGKPVESWVHILDFDNYSIGQATYKAGIDDSVEISGYYEANYPERLKAGIIVNAPSIFTYVYSFIKLVLPPETIQKIKVFGKDEYSEELLKLIDPEVLPASLGGTKRDPDGNPRCLTEILYGKPVPKSYYLKNFQPKLASKPGVKKYDLKRRNLIQVVHKVQKPGSCLEWEFETENHNIGFGISYKAKEDQAAKATQLVPIQKIDAHIQTEVGTFHCQKSGLYILMLDNSYSWFTSKHVYLRSYVTEPANEISQTTQQEENL